LICNLCLFTSQWALFRLLHKHCLMPKNEDCFSHIFYDYSFFFSNRNFFFSNFILWFLSLYIDSETLNFNRNLNMKHSHSFHLNFSVLESICGYEILLLISKMPRQIFFVCPLKKKKKKKKNFFFLYVIFMLLNGFYMIGFIKLIFMHLSEILPI